MDYVATLTERAVFIISWKRLLYQREVTVLSVYKLNSHNNQLAMTLVDVSDVK